MYVRRNVKVEEGERAWSVGLVLGEAMGIYLYEGHSLKTTYPTWKVEYIKKVRRPDLCRSSLLTVGGTLLWKGGTTQAETIVLESVPVPERTRGTSCWQNGGANGKGRTNRPLRYSAFTGFT